MLKPCAAGLVERSSDPYEQLLAVAGGVLDRGRTGPVRATDGQYAGLPWTTQ